MDKEKALQIAHEYAKTQKEYKFNVILYAGIFDGAHCVWLKDTSMPRYTGGGCVLSVYEDGAIDDDLYSFWQISRISMHALKSNGFNNIREVLLVKE